MQLKTEMQPRRCSLLFPGRSKRNNYMLGASHNDPYQINTVLVLRVKLHCPACVTDVKKTLQGMHGVVDVHADERAELVAVKGRDLHPVKIKDRLKRKTGKIGEIALILTIAGDGQPSLRYHDANLLGPEQTATIMSMANMQQPGGMPAHMQQQGGMPAHMQQQGGMPPQDPHMQQQGGMPPQDPHMQQQGGMPPPDPNMQQYGGMPQPDPNMQQYGGMPQPDPNVQQQGMPQPDPNMPPPPHPGDPAYHHGGPPPGDPNAPPPQPLPQGDPMHPDQAAAQAQHMQMVPVDHGGSGGVVPAHAPGHDPNALSSTVYRHETRAGPADSRIEIKQQIHTVIEGWPSNVPLGPPGHFHGPHHHHVHPHVYHGLHPRDYCYVYHPEYRYGEYLSEENPNACSLM